MRFSIVAISFLFVFAPLTVFADAWWGEGYRSPEWVLANGGSIIRYSIVGTSNPDKVKAMMLRDGKYVEIEFGNNATFDDAKDGVYEIKFYECDGSCKPHMTNNKTKIRSSDDRTAIIYVTARPGQTTNIIYDENAETARIVSVSGGAPPKPKYTREQLIGFAAEREKGQVCARTDAHPFVEDSFVFPQKGV